FSQFGIRNVQKPLGDLAGEAGMFTLSYFLISTALIASYVSFSKDLPLVNLWREKFLWTILSYTASGVSCLAAYLLVGRLGLYVFIVLIAMMMAAFASYRFYFLRVGSQEVGQAA
ncbi:MAG TPA: hypothetical protein VNO14_08885, partial [Blastocatellia bacterium]|nr:hypothetical protein [Blastocatellia bacterium]